LYNVFTAYIYTCIQRHIFGKWMHSNALLIYNAHVNTLFEKSVFASGRS